MFKSLSNRTNSRAVLLPALFGMLLAVPLAACASGPWPQLSSVERPAGAVNPEPLEEIEEGAADTKIDSPAPQAEDAFLDAAEGDELDSFRQSVTLAEETAERTWATYVTALDQLLASGGDEEELVSRWSTAQSALSRFSMAVDMLRDLRDEAARRALQFSSGQTSRSQRARLLPTGELVSHLSTATEERQRQIAGENNRLAVLTPPAFGAPGPAAVFDGGRTPFAVIDFSGPKPRYAERLTQAVREVQGLVPDLGLDIIMTGPADETAAQQAALRQVLRELRRAGTRVDATAVAIGPASDRVEAWIYLRKTSL